MAQNSKKISLFRCLASFLPAAGVTVLCCVLLAGPRLGPFYDFLLRRRPAPPISRELLLIDSSVPAKSPGDDILEPGTVSSLLYTMTELGARTLIIQVPVLGLPAGGKATEAEILYRFDEEFSLLSRNIRNLFDAIRTGSVAPSEAARYVGELVELSDKGKERLVAALVRRDEEGIASMEKAAAFFGHVRRPGDLQVQLIMAGEGGRPGVLVERDEYSRARPDRDGVLRRIQPVLEFPLFAEDTERTMEHIIYGALKTRYKTSGIEYTDSSGLRPGRVLYPMVLAFHNGPDGTDTIIPLDQTGAVLFEVPHKGEDFRRIGITDFLAYEEADRELRRLLSEGQASGIFQGVEGENRPPFLYDYARSLREELAANGDEEKKQVWIETRNRYFESLEDFFYGSIETWDSPAQILVTLREKYNEVLGLRTKLESALSDSFCILGRGSSGSSPDMEASALLANSILTGRVVKPGEETYLLLGSLLWAFLTCFFIRSLGPALTLGAGAILTLFAGIVFSLSFIFSGLWLDPLVPAAASGTGVIFSFIWTLIVRGRYSRRFRLTFGPFVSRSCLRSVIRAGGPLPSQTVTARAAVVAVIKTDPPTRRDSKDPRATAQAALAFQEKVSDIFKKAGAAIIGTEGDLVIACFGSPLERVFLGSRKEPSPYEDNIHALAAPAVRAVNFVSEIAARPDCLSWQFGLDIGKCTFAWTAVSGYFALGMPVRRARMLSRLAGRYKARIVISSPVNEVLPDLVAKKLDTLEERPGGEPFYRLAVSE